MGSPPESSTTRPAQRLTTEEGAWNKGRLTINDQPGRIDFVLSAVASDPSNIPTVGLLPEVCESFGKLLLSAKLPKCARLAVGIASNISCLSEAEAIGVFRGLVPALKFQGATDLSVQVNLPKKFPKIGGLRINRLSKWSQLVWQVFEFQMEGGAPANPIDIHIVKLELDLNTAPGSALPPASSYGQIVSLLMSEAIDIAQEGLHETA